MKVHIVTIYNSQNCGSFLQAFALCEFLRNHGYNVSIQRNKISYKNRFLYRLAMMIKYLFKGKMIKALNIMRTYIGFVKCRQKHLSITNKRSADVFVFGSDTIWNLEEKYFNKQWQHYFGYKIKSKKIVYGASVGPADPFDILNNSQLSECLKGFTSVGLRDKKTKKMFELLGISDTVSVLDPTMLLNTEEYNKISLECTDKDFILFYFFGLISEDLFAEIEQFANEKHLELICFGENIPNCSKRMVFNPGLMIAYFKKAKYVVTNTFHGNVFSIIYNKQFINIDAGKEKINDLLDKFDLSNRTVNDSKCIRSVLEQNIDFNRVNDLLNKKKLESQEFLLKSLV